MERVQTELERITGLTEEQIIKMPVKDFRLLVEQIHKKPFTFSVQFPFIGRRDLRGCLISREELDKEIDKFLKEKD